ncbi:MAG: DUF456 domain-containing protein [Actinomycetota bacterium]|jgi:uncharacterized protein YqgC (DUF456 family)|nr:DUF456 domain-containing protein [Actinomycetota bacterium]MDQ3527326.1 DUF456 domain-containing protein [Actinomycetota bacterium]
MTTIAVIAALFMLVGLVGIVIPVLPGLLVVWAGVLLWCLNEQSTTGWWLLGIVTVMYAVGLALQYAIPGKRMRLAGVSTWTLVIGVLVAVVFAFLIPIVGALLGFPLGIYLVERSRRGGHAQAWSATKHALRAVGVNILIDLATGLLIVATWVATLVFFA